MIHTLKQKLKSLIKPQPTIRTVGRIEESDLQLMRQIRDLRLTYLSENKLISLMETVRAMESANIPGSMIEAGCALGGSSILLAKLKKTGRPMRVYDVFGMIPPPGDQDTPDVHQRYETIVSGQSTGLGGDKYYGYEDELYQKVQHNFATFGLTHQEGELELIKGLVQDTLMVPHPVAFAHIDVDWYDPVMTCLERIYPMLSLGGSIILDDYHDWGGCRRATDEYLAKVAGNFTMDDSAGSMKITKTAVLTGIQ